MKILSLPLVAFENIFAEQDMIKRQEASTMIMQDLVIESAKDNDADLPILEIN